MTSCWRPRYTGRSPLKAFYIAGQDSTDDPGAKALMKELAEEELRHSQMVTGLKERDWKKGQWHRENVANLMISEHLTGGDRLEGAGLQQTLIFAMKREQQSVELYSQMMSALRLKDAKRLCERLVNEELRHKQRI